MNGGWVKLYRQSVDNNWLHNHRLWVFWTYCLLKASHQKTVVTIGFQRVPLEAGQFIFGRVKAAAELGMTERQVRTCLDSLKTTSNLTIKTTSKYSIITVVNWHTYQSEDCQNVQQKGQQSDQVPTSNRPATDHIQECKEVKKESISSFSTFWTAYPRKVSKASALKSWQKINPDSSLQGEILKAIEWQSVQPDWQKENGKFIPHPATWLNGRRWEDEQPLDGTPDTGRKTKAEIEALL